MTECLAVGSLEASTPEIGRWLWALEEVRKTTVKSVGGCEQDAIDWCGSDGMENSIGSLLYHLAIVEMSWMYLDVLQQEFPPQVREVLPLPMADDTRRMTRVAGRPLSEHLDRLRSTRDLTLSILRTMDLEEWRRTRSPVDGADYQVTPEWAVFHVIEHEAGHAFQMKSLMARWNRLKG
jgi:uncharacterized damage-inducible protein DinB